MSFFYDKILRMYAPITTFYASILALFFMLLSIRAIQLRRKLKIEIGDATNNEMQRAMRVHANFAEYTPLTLILILLVELNESPYLVTHFICLCLLIGRIAHAYGVSKTIENYKFRIMGMAMTFTSILISSLYLIYTLIPLF